MNGIARWSGVALECPDPAALAHFYSRLTGWSIVFAAPDWYSVGDGEDTAVHLSFQLAPGYRPPHWPDPASSMQLHLHFQVDDLDDAESTALALGATRFTSQPDPASYRVLADPVGHPFCLCH